MLHTPDFTEQEFFEMNKYAPAWNKWGTTEEDKKRDWNIYKEIQEAYSKRDKPYTGNLVKFPDGNSFFIVKYGDRYNITRLGSFAFSTKGYVSYSGGFAWQYNKPSLKPEEIGNKIGESNCEGWFPHNGDLCANCAIYARFVVPVWEAIPEK